MSATWLVRVIYWQGPDLKPHQISKPKVGSLSCFMLFSGIGLYLVALIGIGPYLMVNPQAWLLLMECLLLDFLFGCLHWYCEKLSKTLIEIPLKFHSWRQAPFSGLRLSVWSLLHRIVQNVTTTFGWDCSLRFLRSFPFSDFLGCHLLMHVQWS